MDPDQSRPTTATLEPVWFVYVEVPDRDVTTVREAVGAAVRLEYGRYDSVCFEGPGGMQYFRPMAGSRGGEDPDVVALPLRTLTFSIPREPELLARAVDAVMCAHSYEEPVIYITEALATRGRAGTSADNPNKWWNRGFAGYRDLGGPDIGRDPAA
jgi:hypothetical protein